MVQESLAGEVLAIWERIAANLVKWKLKWDTSFRWSDIYLCNWWRAGGFCITRPPGRPGWGRSNQLLTDDHKHIKLQTVLISVRTLCIMWVCVSVVAGSNIRCSLEVGDRGGGCPWSRTVSLPGTPPETSNNTWDQSSHSNYTKDSVDMYEFIHKLLFRGLIGCHFNINPKINRHNFQYVSK